MKHIKIDNIGDVAILDEFWDIYNGSVSTVIYHTSTKPSEVLNKLKDDHSVIIVGDYQQAEYLFHYLQHYDNKLATSDDTKQSDLNITKVNHATIKRNKLYRVFYVAQKNTFPLFGNIPVEYDFNRWLSEDTQDYYYLLPARRYYRILTDIRRETDGIYFDFIKTKLFIHPFVYVPFDKSVPAMFLSYARLLKDKMVIDIGTGTGILSIMAAQMGAKSVVASDINTNAVECAKKNASCAGFEHIITVASSNLFERISGKFDVVIFNAPWVKGIPKNIYDIAIYDNEFSVVNSFFCQVSEHLTDNGIILLQYSDISQKNGDGSIENLYTILKSNNLYISDSSSILRKNRLLGIMERVYIFVIKKLEDNMIIDNVKSIDELNSVLDLVFSIFPQLENREYKYSREFWTEKFNELPDLLLYARDGNAICGFVFAWDDNGGITITHVGVNSAYRRKGVGKMLMLEAEKRVKVLGYRGITLASVDSAEGFYEKLGYAGALLIQSKNHSIDELLALNTSYEVIYTNIYDENINQICLRVPFAHRMLQQKYEETLPGCYTQMIFGKNSNITV